MEYKAISNGEDLSCQIALFHFYFTSTQKLSPTARHKNGCALPPPQALLYSLMPSTAQHSSTSPPPANPWLLCPHSCCLRLRILVAVARGHKNELLQSCDLGATRGLTAAAARTDNVSTSISGRSFLLFLLPITTRNNIGFE
jgi:hypothetical protein